MITITVEERELMNEIIKNNKVCYVAMIDSEGMPYVIPMNFGFEDDVIYLHSGPEGGAIASLEKNPHVCITFCTEPTLVYQHVDVACSYRIKGSSVICRGKVVFETSIPEKVKGMNVIMKQYTDKVFTYSDPAINNVKIWKIEIDNITTKIFGAANPKSRNYKDQDLSGFY